MPGKNTTYPGDRGAPALGRGVEPAHLERRRVRASCSSCPTVLIAVCDRAHALVVSTQRDRPRPVVSSFLLLFVHGCALWFPKVLRGDPARLQVLQRSHVLRQGGPAGCRTTAKSSLHLDKLKDWPLKRKSEGLPFRRPSGDCFFACFKTRPPGESVARPGRPIRVQGGRRDGDSADACAAIHGRGGGELHRGAAILLLLVPLSEPLSTSSPACASAWAVGCGRSALRRGAGGGGVSAVLRRPRAVQRVGLSPESGGIMPRAERHAFVAVVVGPDCASVPADDLRAVVYDCTSVTDCGYWLYTRVNDATCLGCFRGDSATGSGGTPRPTWCPIATPYRLGWVSGRNPGWVSARQPLDVCNSRM